MSHHLFLLSPSDTPLYSLTHFSAKPSVSTPSPLSANLPSWSTSAFAGTLTALSGACDTGLGQNCTDLDDNLARHVKPSLRADANNPERRPYLTRAKSIHARARFGLIGEYNSVY